MLSVQGTFLGNICQLLLILTLTLGLSSVPQQVQVRSEDGADDGSLIPVLYPLSPPVAGGLSKPGHSLLVASHPLTVLSLLEGTPCLLLFLLTLGFLTLASLKGRSPLATLY